MTRVRKSICVFAEGLDQSVATISCLIEFFEHIFLKHELKRSSEI